MEVKKLADITLNDVEYLIKISLENDKIMIESKEKEGDIPFCYKVYNTYEDFKKINNIFLNMSSLDEIKLFLEEFLSKKENIKPDFDDEEEKMTLQINYKLGPLKKNFILNLSKTILSEKKMIEYLSKQVKMLKKENSKLKKIIESNNISLDGKKDEYKESILISNDKEFNLIKSGIFNLNNKNIKLKSLYVASKDGDNPENFHFKCDGQSPTVSIFKTTKGYIFGGYTDKSWDNKSNALKTDNSFLFSFNIMKIYPGKNGGNIYCSSAFGPWFYDALGAVDKNYLGNKITKQFGYNNIQITWNDFEKDYELTGGEKEYLLKEVEVLKVEFF